MTCSDDLLAYIAGFFDGEGSVFLQTHGSVEVRIAQVDRRPLDLVVEHFGGRVGKLSERPGRTPCFQWRISRWPDALVFLRAIRPWSIVKAEKIDLVLAFYDGCLAELPTAFQHGVALPPHMRVRRIELREALAARTTKGRRRTGVAT
jgi:hypothetical protein